MPPSNSTKKVAKAARSSAGRRASGAARQRGLGYPVAVAMIVVLGVLLVGFGRDQRVSAAQTAPRMGKDHWHAAYGVYVCDTFLPALTDRRGDAHGVHTHGDGIIHIHPSSSVSAGKKADLADFLYEIKLEVSKGKLVIPGGETHKDGDTCADGTAGKVVLAVWDSADDAEAKPRIITSDMSETRFTQDRMAFTIAFISQERIDAGDIPRPESIPTLDNLSDLGGASSGSTPATDDGTDTIQTDSSTSTSAGDGSASTTVPAGATATTDGAGATTSSAPR